MFHAFVFVILLNGQVVHDHGVFQSKKECEAAQEDITTQIGESGDKVRASYVSPCYAFKPGPSA